MFDSLRNNNSVQFNSDLLMSQLNRTMANYRASTKNTIRLDNTQTVQKHYSQTT